MKYSIRIDFQFEKGLFIYVTIASLQIDNIILVFKILCTLWFVLFINTYLTSLALSGTISQVLTNSIPSMVGSSNSHL